MVLDFLADCPAAPATRRRRVIAIDHHHVAAGHLPPGADPQVRATVGRPPLGPAPVASEVRSRVDAALRVLPSRGWTGGLFGQRDRCLLVLCQLVRIPYRQLARLTGGDVTVATGVATITLAGRTWTVEAVDDPVLCGPCASRPLATHPPRHRHPDRHPGRRRAPRRRSPDPDRQHTPCVPRVVHRG